jgi:hypothetical protein
MFQQIKPLTLSGSFRTLALRLWDEQHKKLVGFRHLKTLRNQHGCSSRPDH